MTITIQIDALIVIGVTIVLVGVFALVGSLFKKSDPLAKTPLWMVPILWLVNSIDNMAIESMGHKYAKIMTPYLLAIASFIFLCNILGLFSLPSPTSNFSVTLTLAFITWLTQQIASIKFSGLKAYLHGFIEPIFLFLPMNIFGKFSSLLSMSLRLFGNILAGGLLMSLVYSATGFVSNLIVDFNFLGPIIAPILHAYFDVFAGFIQTLIFITLTVVFVGNEIPDELKD